MPNGRKRSERDALLNSDLIYHPPMKSLTPDQLRSIRFTYVRIHPTFANASRMAVFEVYFAIKYGLMALSGLPHPFVCLNTMVTYGVLIIVDYG